MLSDIKFSKDTKALTTKLWIYEDQKTPADNTKSLGERRQFLWYHFISPWLLYSSVSNEHPNWRSISTLEGILSRTVWAIQKRNIDYTKLSMINQIIPHLSANFLIQRRDNLQRFVSWPGDLFSLNRRRMNDEGKTHEAKIQPQRQWKALQSWSLLLWTTPIAAHV